MIDAEIQTFIEESTRLYPADAASRSIDEQRRLYDAFAALFALPRPPHLIVQDDRLALADRSIALRHYRPGTGMPRGMIVYAHGGGFMLGSLDSHDGIAAQIAGRTGAEVVAVDYRLAPENAAPAARDDVMAVVEAAARGALRSPARGGRLLLAGDSAGAMLVASAALLLRERSDVPLAGLALVYPMLGREPARPARDTEADAPMLTLADVHYYRDLYLAGREPDLWTFPLDAPTLGGFPPTFLFGAEHDPLRDDCTVFAERLRRAGTSVQLCIGKGLVHGCLRAVGRSRAAAAAFDALIAAVDGWLS